MSDPVGSPAPAPVDWDAALSNAAQSQGAPLANNPAAFSDFYGPAADKVSAKTGIDSNTILGQWGLETGWGKSIIPGTNNLGNIKAPKGQGVSAVDNQTGTTDQYKKFDSVDAFADHYADLLSRKYKGALDTGADPMATASALKAGGYAEDPNYVSKLTAAANMVTKARGGTNWDALLGGGQTPPQAQPTTGGGAPPQAALPQTPQTPPSPLSNQPNQPYISGGQKTYTPMADFKASQPSAPPDGTSIPGAVWAGVKESALNKLYGAEKLLGQGMDVFNPGTTEAPDLVNSAEQNLQRVHAESEAAGGHTTPGKLGAFAADVIPYVVAGPESALVQGAIGAGMGATSAAAEGGNPLLGAAFGGGAGALGPLAGRVAGSLLGKGAQAAGGAAAKAGGALGGIGGSAENTAGGAIRDAINASGVSTDDAISSLRAGANSPINNVARSAAEAASDVPALSALQKVVSKSDAGEGVFQAGDAANQAARVAHLDDAVDPNLPGETQDFNTVQTGLQNQAQKELPPLNPDFAESPIVKGDQFQQAVKAARSDASGMADDPFESATEAAHANAGVALENIMGTPEQLTAMKAARKAQAAQDYGEVTGYIPMNAEGMTDLAARDNIAPSWNNAAKELSGFKGEAKPQPIVRGEGPAGQWNTKQVSIQYLQAVKQDMEDRLSSALRAGDWSQAGALRESRDALNKVLGDNSSAYTAANQRYAAMSAPISRMQAMQDRLATVYDPETNLLRPGKIGGAIDSIKNQWQKGYITQADHVTPQDILALGDVAAQARAAKTTIANLSPKGQLMVLDKLRVNAANAPESAAHANALTEFEDHLRGQSPTMAAHIDTARTVGKDLADRQLRQDILAQARDKINTIHNAGGTLDAGNVGRALDGLLNKEHAGTAEGQKAYSLLNDLQNKAAVGSQGITASMPQHWGLLGKIISHATGEGVAVGSLAHGNIPHAAVALAGGGIMKRGQANLNKAMVDLLSPGNANKLADVLERVKK